MLLVHKVELSPNNRQRTFFARACGVACFAWNWALAEWKRQYEAGGKPTEAALRRQLNAIKADEFPWMLEAPKSAPQQAIKDLGTAFGHFFRRVTAGQKPGYPRFKKRGIRDSFRADNGPPAKGKDAVAVDGRRVRVPRLGWVRMREPLRFQGQVKSLVISRKADRWFAAIAVETENLPHASRKNHGGAVGVDLGIKAMATLSTGEVVTGPKPHRAKLRRLARLSRSLSRKKKLSRLHKQIADIRLDAIHKFTTRLVLDYDRIGIEDLNVRGMVRNRHLSRSIMDRAFHEIRRQLEYKAGWYGAQVVVADRFFPSTKMCSGCGTVHDMPLSRRTMRCGCGLEIDRDLNAAINLERYTSTASSAGIDACGENGAGAMAPATAWNRLGEAGTQRQSGSGRSGQDCVSLWER